MAFSFFLVLFSLLLVSVSLIKIPFAFPLLIIFLLGLILIKPFLERRMNNNIVFFLIFVILSIAYGVLSFSNSADSIHKNIVGQEISVRGEVVKDSFCRKGYTFFDFKVWWYECDGEHEKSFLLKVITEDKKRFYRGQKLFIRGTAAPVENKESNYCLTKIKGYQAVLLSDEIVALGFAKENLSKRLANKMKASVALSPLESEHMVVVLGILFGEKSFIAESEYKKYSVLNILHLLTVSGMHFALLAWVIDLFLRIMLVPFLIRRVTGIFFLMIFLAVTGFPPSALRAFIMIFFYYLSAFINRKPKPLNIIGSAGIILLLIKPDYVLYPGFILSFTMTSFLAGPWQKIDVLLINYYKYKFKLLNMEERGNVFLRGQRMFCRLLLFSLFAWLVSLPLCLFFFGVSSIYSPLANLALAFIIPYIFIFSFLGAVINLFLPALAEVIFLPVKFLSDLMIRIVDFFLALPFSQLKAEQVSFLYVLGFYMLILLISDFIYKKAGGALQENYQVK